MTDRVLLRSGTGGLPPLVMNPGELACSDNGQLYLGGFTGSPQSVPTEESVAQIVRSATLVLDGGTF